jgi:hypothetical protein
MQRPSHNQIQQFPKFTGVLAVRVDVAVTTAGEREPLPIFTANASKSTPPENEFFKTGSDSPSMPIPVIMTQVDNFLAASLLGIYRQKVAIADLIERKLLMPYFVIRVGGIRKYFIDPLILFIIYFNKMV